MTNNLHIKNKKAYFEYSIQETFTAGVKLLGTEIKSVRESKVSLNDAYCLFINDILFVRNLHIAEYALGSFYNHEAKRDRALLLNKKELKKIQSQIKEKGLSLIPLHLFINDRGFAKLQIGLGRGKKLYDKRESIKERDTAREMERRV